MHWCCVKLVITIQCLQEGLTCQLKYLLCVSFRAVGMRLANVYDINNKTYLFKLAK